MTDLNDGLCVQAEDPSPWLDPPRVGNKAYQSHAKALCHGCPVIAACATFAEGQRWTGVIVAGWRAPAIHPHAIAGWPVPWKDDPSRHPVTPAARTIEAFLRERVTA